LETKEEKRSRSTAREKVSSAGGTTCIARGDMGEIWGRYGGDLGEIWGDVRACITSCEPSAMSSASRGAMVVVLPG